MSDNLLVSIITPCYNSGKTIEKTLQCIENQTYKNIEYIIIDGASTDNTMEIINRHKPNLPNVKIVSEKDGGIYEAMNKGIKLASGELIGIVNSDDWYENDTVEQVVNAYKGNKYEVVYGMQRNYEDSKEKSIILYRHEFLYEHNINHPTCFVTKDTYSDLGMFDTSFRSAADYDLMLRFWKSDKVKFNPIMKILSNFQFGGMSSSQTGVRENAKIRYKEGYMSRKKYYFVVIKSYIYEILNKK
jgi:glycosyltransferase involved in cell wall biosynthesis